MKKIARGRAVCDGGEGFILVFSPYLPLSVVPIFDHHRQQHTIRTVLAYMSQG